MPRAVQPWDFVTTARASVDVVDKSRLADSLLRAGVNGNAFVYNSDLAFVSTDVFAASDMTRGVSELVRGLRLRITDSFRYTPEMPAFLEYGGHPDDTADIYSGGIQGSRANTYRNILKANSDYSLSRSFSLTTNYSFSMFRRGRSDPTSDSLDAVAYFNNTQHAVDIGPTYTFDGGDTLFFKYNYSKGESVPEEGRSNHRLHVSDDRARVCDQSSARLDPDDQRRSHTREAAGEPCFPIGEIRARNGL